MEGEVVQELRDRGRESHGNHRGSGKESGEKSGHWAAGPQIDG